MLRRARAIDRKTILYQCEFGITMNDSRVLYIRRIYSTMYTYGHDDECVCVCSMYVYV